MKGSAPGELKLPNSAEFSTEIIKVIRVDTSPSSTLQNAAGTSSEGSVSTCTSTSPSPPASSQASCSNSNCGGSEPASPSSALFRPGGVSPPLSPLCNDHPITQLHLQTDFELYRLEQELGSSDVPDPHIADPIFEDDFAAVMESLEMDNEDTATIPFSDLLNQSICSDTSDMEISARALDMDVMEPPERLQSIWEDECVTLSPLKSACMAEDAPSPWHREPDTDQSPHPFSILKRSEQEFAEVAICCHASSSPEDQPRHAAEISSSSTASDNSCEEIAQLTRSLPGDADEPDWLEDSGDSFPETHAAVAHEAWTLGVLAGGLICLGSLSRAASRAALEFLSLLVACHANVGPAKASKPGCFWGQAVFFNHVYIITHLWARSRSEVLNDSYYDTDCSDGNTDSLDESICLNSRFRNPLFCMLNLPPPSPRSPRAQVPAPGASHAYLDDSEGSDRACRLPSGLPRNMEEHQSGPGSPLSKDRTPTPFIVTTDTASLQELPISPRLANSDAAQPPIQSLRSKYAADFSANESKQRTSVASCKQAQQKPAQRGTVAAPCIDEALAQPDCDSRHLKAAPARVLQRMTCAPVLMPSIDQQILDQPPQPVPSSPLGTPLKTHPQNAGPGLPAQDVPTCESCGSRNLVCSDCGWSNLAQHSLDQAAPRPSSSQHDKYTGLRESCERIGESVAEAGLFDDYMDLCEELLLTDPADLASTYCEDSCCSKTLARTDHSFLGCTTMRKDQEMERQDEIIDSFLSCHVCDITAGASSSALDLEAFLGFGHDAMLDGGCKRRLNAYSPFCAPLEDGTSLTAAAFAELGPQTASAWPQRENPSMANWLSSTVSESAAEEMQRHEVMLAASITRGSTFKYQLQLDALEQDRLMLKGYLSRLQEHLEVC